MKPQETFLQQKAQHKHVGSGLYKDLMTLVIDTVPNVFIEPLESEHWAGFSFSWDSRGKDEKKRGEQTVWQLFLKRCADESCIAQPSTQGKQTSTHTSTHTQTHHPETLGNAATYGLLNYSTSYQSRDQWSHKYNERTRSTVLGHDDIRAEDQSLIFIGW